MYTSRVFVYVLALVVVLAIFAVLVWRETELRIFYPSKKKISPVASYKEYYVSPSGRVSTKVSPDSINIRHYKLNGANKDRIILFFHGNTGNISQRNYVVRICQILRYNLVLCDYHGFGKSPGEPKTNLLLRDAQAAYNFTAARYEPSDVVVWGESLGGGAASWVAHKNTCRSLVLFSTYSSLTGVISQINSYPKLARDGVCVLLKSFTSDVPTHKWLPSVKCNVVIVHSLDDDFIHISNAEKNYSVSREPKSFIKIHGKHAAPIVEGETMREILQKALVSLEDVEDYEYTEICHILYNAAENNDLLIKSPSYLQDA